MENNIEKRQFAQLKHGFTRDLLKNDKIWYNLTTYKKQEEKWMKFIEKTNASIQVLAAVLAVVAVWFAKMPCWGKFYEPEMPEQLKD